MEKRVRDYLEANFTKVTKLKESERGTVWLAKENAGQFVIWKEVQTVGLPYKLLKQNPCHLWPRVLYCAEDTEKNDTVIIEEFINGDTLDEYLGQGKHFDEAKAVAVLLQLCDGLEKLHKLNVIHRDIKPGNIKMFKDKVYLIDFDAAREYKEEKDEDTHIVATKEYAPPEQYGSEQTDERSDIYSLGKTMQNMLGQEYNGKLLPILEKCTQFAPKDRYQNIKQLKADIEKAPGWSIWKKTAVVASALVAAAILSDD